MILPRRRVSRALLVLTATALALLPSAAGAQAPTSAESVKVSLWPEYDRRAVLVIYRVILPAAASLPATVRLPIPADAPELTAAAFRDENGELLNAAANRVEGDEADVIEVESEGTEVQIEFYLPLATAEDLRQFSFTWPGGLAAGDLTYEVQQPIGAQAMQVEPAPTSRVSDAQGLAYHLVDVGPLAAGDRPEVSFRYQKDTDQLSAEAAPLSGLATPAPAAATGIDLAGLLRLFQPGSGVLPWALLVGGLSLLIGGVVFFLRGRADERVPRPRHRSARPAAEGDDGVDAAAVFCHNCGTRATAADRFCRQCGTALRT